MPAFILDPRLASASIFIADLPVCQARLQDDERFAWLVLIPREAEVCELEQLSAAARAGLMDEIVAAGDAVRAIGAALGRPVARLNLGQLGLIVPQLHLHVVGRRTDDTAWPSPVWGRGEPARYGDVELEHAVSTALKSLQSYGLEMNFAGNMTSAKEQERRKYNS